MCQPFHVSKRNYIDKLVSPDLQKIEQISINYSKMI